MGKKKKKWEKDIETLYDELLAENAKLKKDNEDLSGFVDELTEAGTRMRIAADKLEMDHGNLKEKLKEQPEDQKTETKKEETADEKELRLTRLRIKYGKMKLKETQDGGPDDEAVWKDFILYEEQKEKDILHRIEEEKIMKEYEEIEQPA